MAAADRDDSGYAARFARRFFYGTARWNASTRLAVSLAFVVGVAAGIVLMAPLHSRGDLIAAIAVSGVGIVVVTILFLYWGARAATDARALDEELVRIETDRKISERLREALQPRLPKLQTLGFSATYVPASTGEIGGDWYDAFELPDGRIMFSIGDVAGHGVEAAVTMSRARQAILAVALEGLTPGDIFERANRVLLLQDTKFATAICGYIDPIKLQVTYATAGHPPAILVGLDGVPQQLAYDGLPLGIAEDTYRGFEIRVDHGAMLVLYTDGLLEYDRDLLAGEARILEAVSRIARQQLDNPAEAIRDAIFKDYQPTDDVAILTIAFEQVPASAGESQPQRLSVDFRGVRATMPSSVAAGPEEG